MNANVVARDLLWTSHEKTDKSTQLPAAAWPRSRLRSGQLPTDKQRIARVSLGAQRPNASTFEDRDVRRNF